jgi:hypothetical protein
MKSSAASKAERLTLSGEIHLQNEPGFDEVLEEMGIAERRVKLRINHPFPTKVWGKDATGKAFEVECVLVNLSSSGLYLRLPRQMKSGGELSVVIRFLHQGRDGATAVLLGQVLRDEPQSDGNHGLALAIREHHFL